MRKAWQRVVAFVAAPIVAFAIGIIPGFVLGALVVVVLHDNYSLKPVEQRRVAAFSEVPDDEAGELAGRFRPWLLFDSAEQWRPLNVDRLFKERTHRFCERPPTAQTGVPGPTLAEAPCKRIGNLANFTRLVNDTAPVGSAKYIDLAGSKLDDYRGPDRCGDLLDCGSGPGSAIYYHVTESNDRFYVDYWWFLRFNHFYRSGPRFSCKADFAAKNGICDEHEGDWEGVTVVTPPGEQDRIDYVVYAAHKGTFRYTSPGFRTPPGQPTRPVVYVARGSHASYPTKCPRKCIQPAPLAFQGLIPLPESRYDGGDSWERNRGRCKPNAPGSCLLALRTEQESETWSDWPGQWGNRCGDVCGGRPGANSPQSPGTQSRYQTPACSSQNGLFTCDGKALGCNDWLGPLVVAVACDPDRLANGLTEPKERKTGTFAITVRRKQEEKTRARETTPGVVQLVGRPLEDGDTVTLTGNARGVEILVRAQRGDRLLETRFDKLNVESGRPLVVSVGTRRGRLTVRLPGHEAAESRVLKLAPPRG